MARNKNDSVELVITARNETAKSFDEIKKSADELTSTLTKKPTSGGLFDGLEKQLERLADRKKQVDKLITDTASLQKATADQKAFAASIDAQSQVITKNQTLLAKLKAEYVDIAKAASSARVPSEKLTQALAELQGKQASLGDKIASTRQELERSNQALTVNAGLDERAAAAIAKQQSSILDAGKAWRSLTKDVTVANKALVDIANRRDAAVATQANSGGRLEALRAELDLVRQISREAQRQASSKKATTEDKAAAIAAKDRLEDLTAVYNESRQAQAQLTREIDKLNAAYRRQETQVAKLKDGAAKQKTIYDNLKKSIVAFTAAQKQEGNDRQVSNIAKITAALDTLETQYASTTAKIAAANAAIGKASGVDPRAIQQRDLYEQKIREATIAVQKEQQELVELRTKMDAAGVSTAALTVRQKELDAVTERLVAEQQRLATQMGQIDNAAKRAGTSVAGIGKTFLNMGNDTRTSLGYLQRIRGELLSIIATTTGLYAVGGAIRSIYDTSVLFNKAESRFAVFFKGDADAVKQEVQFVRQLADTLKIEFESALDEYSKFVSGLDPAKIPLEQVRGVFEGFATAARVGSLSADDFGGVMRALTQIFSKQKVQLEELQGQLADRMPGAVRRTAEALQLTEQELRKLIESGGLGSDAMILLANNLQKEFGTNLGKALESPSAAVADFQNSISDLKKEIANSGFIEQLTGVLKELTKSLKDPATRQGITDIVKGIGQIGQVFIYAIQHASELSKILGVLFGGKILLSVVKFGAAVRTSLVTFQAYMTTAAVAGSRFAGVIATATKLIRGFLGVLGAGAAGYAFGTWLNQFAVVQKAGYTFIAMLDLLKHTVITVAKVLQQPWNAIELAKDFGDAAKRIAKDVGEMYDAIDKEASAQDKKFRENLEKDLAIKVNAGDMANPAEGFLDQAAIDEMIKNLTGGISDSTDKKLKTLEESILNSLNDIDRQIQEQSADTLEQRLDAINLEYTKLLKKIDKATAAGSKIDFSGARGQIDQLVAIKQVQEVEKEINKLIAERKQSIDEINTLSTTGAITVEEATKRINAENARILPQLDTALAKAKEISGKINSAPISQSVGNLDRTVDVDKQRAGLEQITILQSRLNEQMSVYREQVQTINALVQSGAVTEAQGKEDIIALQKQTNEQASITIAKMRELILANEQFAKSFEGQRLLESLKQAGIELTNVKEKLVDAADVNKQFSSGLVDAFDGFISGAMSAKDAFRSFIADFLRNIAKAILQQIIFNALQKASGGGIGGAIGAAVNHTGGIVGQTASRRRVDPGMFATAVKYHTGGLAGLKSNEVPSILQKGEEVLTRNDPRHILNGGGGGQTPAIKIVNAFDRDTVAKETFSSPYTTKAMLNIIRSNKSEFSAALK
jgi:tape measure domain-containing protein